MFEYKLLNQLSLGDFQKNTSVKWTQYPPEVLPLWVAEMDVAPAPEILQTISAAFQSGNTGYLGAFEEMRYLEAFSEFSERRFGFSPDVSFAQPTLDVITTLTTLTQILAEKTAGKTNVIIASPCYPPFFERIAGGCNIIDAALSENGRLDFLNLENAFQTAKSASESDSIINGIFLLCNPHNPLGTYHTRSELERLAELADIYKIFILSDEIHHALSNSQTAFTPYLSVKGVKNAVCAVSGSKSYNIACLKTAMAIPAPDDFSIQIVKNVSGSKATASYASSLLPVLAQTTGFNECDYWVDQIALELEQNQLLLAQLLKKYFPEAVFVSAQGSFLQWINLDSYSELAKKHNYSSMQGFFLNTCKVAFTAGEPFGGKKYRNYVRINFGTNPEIIKRAFEQISQNL